MNNMKEYIITVADPVSELRKDLLHDDNGVYFVFSAKQTKQRRYSMLRLLYIGRSNDVNSRINGNHHKHDAILEKCSEDNGVPVYYFGSIVPNTTKDIVRVEAALIFHKKPILNETADKEFHHPNTHILLKRVEESKNIG